ncbi:MAG: AraC family transcriptional regulator [Polaribacter sp.]|nr:AraC family transcriptional regulator [Polaribacter sp.]
MKILPFKISKSENVSLIYQEDIGEIFYDKLHQHEEIQLCAIVEGEGNLVVGDTINEYTSGDVLVIGSNLPHVFKSDTSTYKSTFMMTLFFTKDSFGERFFKLGDFSVVEKLFKISSTGGKVTSNQTALMALFLSLKKASYLDRFIIFLRIVSLILTSESVPLSNFVYQKAYSDNEGKRMSNVMDFTMNHFFTEINLKTISGVSNMTPNAFCRYFKQRTNKTYFQFLIEVRIENACRLLKNKDLLVSEISEKSGFKNISNFNRKFKSVKGITPSAYRLSS